MKELFPFAIQGMIMGIDEFYCHQRRELRRWERIGHPLDTLLYLLCLTWLLMTNPSTGNLIVFCGLSVASCLFISKDEWQHRELCSGFENWLHSLLFMLYPVLLIWAGWLWWTVNSNFAFVGTITVAIGASFVAYQSFFWNVWHRG